MIDRRAMSETTTEPEATPVDLEDPALYYNRELSWMQFNARVLELAEDPGVPLLERVKFCAIYSSNLDEFVMVRVAGLHDQIDAGIEKPLQDGRTPRGDDGRAAPGDARADARASRGCSSRTCGPRWPSTASASSAAPRSARPTGARSTSSSAARSSRC